MCTACTKQLRERACEMERMTERERKFDIVVLFWTLIFGLASRDRTVQALLERYVATQDDINSAHTSPFPTGSLSLRQFLREFHQPATQHLKAGVP